MRNKQTILRLFLVIILLYILGSGKLFAQKINRDSLKRVAFVRDSIKHDSIAAVANICDIAKRDSKKQRLTPAEITRFKADDKNSNSDLFKPQKNIVSDTLLVYDSVYVKAFRKVAYQKALDDNPKIEKCIWLAFGLGGSFGSSDNGGGGNLFVNANLEIHKQLIISTDIHAAVPFPEGTTIVNFGILLGKIYKQKFFHL
jgi:hypothetical protein